jgi:hypothetical protein
VKSAIQSPRGKTVGLEFEHKNAQLAAEFLRENIKAEYSKKSAPRASAALSLAAQ